MASYSCAEDATATFEEAMAGLEPIAKAAQAVMSKTGATQGSLEFGFKLSAAGNIVVVKGGAEASFKVSFTWKGAG